MVKLNIVEVVDEDTGEITQVKRNRKAMWYKGVIKANMSIVDMDLAVSDFRVMHWLLGNISYGNRVVVNQGRLADYLKLSRKSVNTSLGKLVKYGIVSKSKRGFTGVEYVFSSVYVYCGTNVRDERVQHTEG